jgi:D-xylose transport system substrate-binding protein
VPSNPRKQEAVRVQRKLSLAVVGVLGFALALTACGDDSDDGGSDNGGGGGDASAGKVGVILPDTESSVRWESADRPALEAAFDAAGVEFDIQNAEGDAEKMTTIADGMIADGVTVLAIVNLDSESGAAIQEKAASQGVKTIDYDRLTLGGSADYYVSFDNSKVGTLQGQGLADCLGDVDANIVFLNGSPTDNNATLFAAGAHAVLDPISTYTVVGEQAVPDWDNEQAVTIFEQLYTQANGKVDGVLAANDGLGGSVISVLEENGLAGKVPVTGQDATVEGLQNVLAGTQCMTVYKSAKLEAGALADAAIALVNGEEAETTGTTEDATGGRDVPSILLDPVSITKDNVKDVIDDGGQAAADVCAGEFAAACTEAGIS